MLECSSRNYVCMSKGNIFVKFRISSLTSQSMPEFPNNPYRPQSDARLSCRSHRANRELKLDNVNFPLIHFKSFSLIWITKQKQQETRSVSLVAQFNFASDFLIFWSLQFDFYSFFSQGSRAATHGQSIQSRSVSCGNWAMLIARVCDC